MIDFELYKKEFQKKARELSYSEDIIQKCISYSENLNNQHLPIIYNTYHLSGLVGYAHSYLTRVCISTSFFYRNFEVLKKNGKKRKILEPLPSLKQIQYFILKEILYSQKTSRYCKSYIPKKKFREYLKYHSNEKEVLCLDIQDFFPSIKYPIIHKFFSDLGYAEDVSDYLAHLCTYHSFAKKDNYIQNNRCLPQGAPTSPYLSNLILKEFDDNVASFCKKNNIKYTRYADDMTFSGESIPKSSLISFVKDKLSHIGLFLNEDKTNFMKQNEPQIVSGVIINRKIQLPKNVRNDIRKVMYFIKKYGIENHMEKTNEKRSYYINHLLGKIQYGLSLNPDDNELKKYRDEIYLLMSSNRGCDNKSQI